ncbi:MAG: ribosome biogenesis GTPase Der [Bacteroidaceae bacterium]|jgi:GTP-binding protein|nr:ribosome biogenesis GTPase Der [Bacteroidaceae bacterium]HAE25506.1 ribosome biogenesis GTPase Der [Prevotellaceae bacterium]
MSSNIVSIVGRPNVGKSTLFNRLTKTRQAIVSDISGTTRDRQYGVVEWNGKTFSLIDTGGWVAKTDDVFEDEIRRQVKIAAEEADVILFVVDIMTGITDIDNELADVLRRVKKPVFVVSNKTDNNTLLYNAAEFYSLGLGEPYCISAMSGSGTGDLLDEIIKKLDFSQTEEESSKLPRFAVVGRPNVGKSSLINAFMGEERHIVTDIAGTTRDSIDTHYNKFGMDFYLVDTAGIRKKTKVSEDLEFYSVMRSIRAIENSDVCVLMIDGERGIESQDVNIYRLIMNNKKGLVVFVNKWDIIKDKSKESIKYFENTILSRTAPFTDYPILFGSALTNKNIFKVLQAAYEVYDKKQKLVGTSKLNETMLPLIEAYPPPSMKGKYIKIKYCSQLPNTSVPTFVFYANLPQYIKEPYIRFLENKIREKWDFKGTPIRILINQK